MNNSCPVSTNLNTKKNKYLYIIVAIALISAFLVTIIIISKGNSITPVSNNHKTSYLGSKLKQNISSSTDNRRIPENRPGQTIHSNIKEIIPKNDSTVNENKKEEEGHTEITLKHTPCSNHTVDYTKIETKNTPYKNKDPTNRISLKSSKLQTDAKHTTTKNITTLENYNSPKKSDLNGLTTFIQNTISLGNQISNTLVKFLKLMYSYSSPDYNNGFKGFNLIDNITWLQESIKLYLNSLCIVSKSKNYNAIQNIVQEYYDDILHITHNGVNQLIQDEVYKSADEFIKKLLEKTKHYLTKFNGFLMNKRAKDTYLIKNGSSFDIEEIIPIQFQNELIEQNRIRIMKNTDCDDISFNKTVQITPSSNTILKTLNECLNLKNETIRISEIKEKLYHNQNEQAYIVIKSLTDKLNSFETLEHINSDIKNYLYTKYKSYYDSDNEKIDHKKLSSTNKVRNNRLDNNISTSINQYIILLKNELMEINTYYINSKKNNNENNNNNNKNTINIKLDLVFELGDLCLNSIHQRISQKLELKNDFNEFSTFSIEELKNMTNQTILNDVITLIVYNDQVIFTDKENNKINENENVYSVDIDPTLHTIKFNGIKYKKK